MKPELYILHLEDNRTDAALIHSLLCEQGIACEMERVQTREDFIAALGQGNFDLIISDFTLPGFDGLAALEIARQKRPDVPFLFVSGTLGEEVAIDSLKRGATDYVLKQRLSRLMPAVRRAIAETEERAATERAEQALTQSEFKYRHLFECLSEAAFLVDATVGRVLDANKQAEVLLGLTRGEIMGLNQDRFLPPSTLETFRLVFADAQHQPARVSFEGKVRTKDGGAVPVEISAAPITLHGRRLLLGLYRTIGERKMLEADLRELTGELEHHLRVRTGELAAAQHELETFSRFLDRDLRERLRAIGGFARQMLTHDAPQLDASSGPALTLIRNGSEQAEQLLERLLAFIRFREQPMKPSLLDMTSLFQAVFEELKRGHPEREFQFHLEPLPSALGDREEIRQVLAELLANAIKFTGGRMPAEIEISARVEDTQNTYYVRDNGVGFPTQDADRLFRVFERLHKDDEFEGVGLGLALVQRIIRRHGGHVGAEGRADVGAIFCFTLPKAVQPHEHPGQSSETGRRSEQTLTA